MTTTTTTKRLRIGFSDHALERFCERGGVPERSREVLDRALRELIARDGRVVHDRPPWATSRRDADLFVQIGRWLLIVLVDDDRRPEGAYTAVTILGREGFASWARAYDQELVSVRPPRWARPRVPWRRRIARWLRRR